MPKLIFDIETIGEDFDKLDKTTQETLTWWIKKEAISEEDYETQLEDLKAGLGFSALTGEIVAIGVLNYDSSDGAVYFQAPGQTIETVENNIKFKSMTEKEMLEQFWQLAERCDEFISFNGRSFDAPFLIIRSAVHKIKPTKNLMSNRYLESQRFDAKHVDLMDQLTFYGASRKRGNLHLWSRVFNIQSPKTQGVSGDDIAPLFKKKKFLEIARYNVGDLIATKELYERWSNYVKL